MASRDSGVTDDGYARDLVAMLDLERLDRDLFRGRNTVGAKGRPALYGGQVAAQALMAAGLTVSEDRWPHSLHGYFLRPGLVDRPVIFQVDRDRDGGSFSARHVSAIQDGDVIFSMLASFQAGDVESLIDETPRRDERVGPEQATPRVVDGLLEVREVTTTDIEAEVVRFSDCMWMRATCRLPDDRLTHACALAYLSDHGTGFGQVVDEVLGGGGPSLDHVLWFHEPIRADEWVLLDLWPTKAVRGRGLYQGSLRAEDGRLGATLAQEHLLGRWKLDAAARERWRRLRG
jgi:acyl-CoA thioesterase-2